MLVQLQFDIQQTFLAAFEKRLRLAMEYLIRFAQAHETFRQPEIEALAALAGIEVEFVIYDHYVGALLFEFFTLLFPL